MFLRPQLPSGTDPKRYGLCLLGPWLLGVSVGVQATITALLSLGPGSAESFAGRLTEYGRLISRPEHDLPIFVAGAALTLAMAGMLAWYWRASLARVEPSRMQDFMTGSALLQAVLATSSATVFLLMLASDWFSLDFRYANSERKPPTDELAALRLLVPGLMALVCAAVDLRVTSDEGRVTRGRPRHSSPDTGHAPWQGRSRHSSPDTRHAPWLGRILCYAVPVFIILVLWVPPGRWPYLTGHFYSTDQCHHLNLFFMGPALAFAHGKAFGTGIFSQYGIGWPLLASVFSHASALTYANMVGIEVVVACAYYITLFYVLRAGFAGVLRPESPVLSPKTPDSGLKTQDSAVAELWAAFGVLLALCWQMFSGLGDGQIILQTPSSTMMRHSLDLAFFFALVMHQRSGRVSWTAIAGFACGLGVFFETETGGYLLVTFLIYAVLSGGRPVNQGRPASWKALLLPPAICWGTAVATLLPLLLYASRGTLFSGAFLRGWLEAQIRYPSLGLDFIPVAELPDAVLLCFVAMIAVYLAVIAYAVVRALHGSASRAAILLASLSAYGLAMQLVFLGRSHPFNLCHGTVPFAVLITALLFWGYNALARRVGTSSLPYALPAGLLLLLVTKPQFASYPSLAASAFQSAPAAGLAMRSSPLDLAGLPQAVEPFVREARDISTAIRTVAPGGQGVAILNLNDTLLYSLANACPWSRYAPLYYAAWTQPWLDGIRNELATSAPNYVVTRGPNPGRRGKWDFIWEPLYGVVTNRYVRCQVVDGYELWALPTSALMQCERAEGDLAKGRLAAAIGNYTAAIQHEPSFALALNRLAWIRATEPDAAFRNGAEAVRLAERACRVTGYKEPVLMTTLAAAYAEAGRYDQAAATAEKAGALAMAAGHAELAAKDEQLRELFNQHKPWREPAPGPRGK